MGKHIEKGKHTDGKKGVQKTSKREGKGAMTGKVEPPAPSHRVSRKSSPSTLSTTSTEKGGKPQFVYSTPPHRVTNTQSPQDEHRSKSEKRGRSPADPPPGRKSALKKPEPETQKAEEISRKEKKDNEKKDKKEKKPKIERDEKPENDARNEKMETKVSEKGTKQTKSEKPASSTAGKEKQGKTEDGKKRKDEDRKNKGKDKRKAPSSESDREGVDVDAEFEELCKQIEEQSTDDGEQEDDQEEENSESESEDSESDTPREVKPKEGEEDNKTTGEEGKEGEEEGETSSDPSQSDSDGESSADDVPEQPVPSAAVKPEQPTQGQQLVAAAGSAVVGDADTPAVANSTLDFLWGLLASYWKSLFGNSPLQNIGFCYRHTPFYAIKKFDEFPSLKEFRSPEEVFALASSYPGLSFLKIILEITFRECPIPPLR